MFVHVSALEQPGISRLAEGQNTEYEVVSGRDGRTSAENVRLVDEFSDLKANLGGRIQCGRWFARHRDSDRRNGPKT